MPENDHVQNLQLLKDMLINERRQAASEVDEMNLAVVAQKVLNLQAQIDAADVAMASEKSLKSSGYSLTDIF